MFEASYKMKDFFFDRPAVDRALDRATKKNLSKAGAYIRKRARSSLRRRKKPASPGSPPSVHSDDNVANLKNILFAFDPNALAVFIGPVGLNQRNYSSQGYSTTIPALMEFGGTIYIREWRFDMLDRRTFEMVMRNPSMMKFAEEWTRADQRWQNASRKRKWTLRDLGVEYRVRPATYPKRPFMLPALEEEVKAGTILNLWSGSVTAGGGSN